LKTSFILAALFLLSVITYVDRACISSARGDISAALGLSDVSMGLVFSAFSLGYALAQVPAGWLADRIGACRLLAVAVICWSLMTAATAAAWSFASLFAIRLVFGVFEAAAFPGAARVIASSFPPARRGFANGILFSGSRIGAALSFPVFAAMMASLGWRWSFALLAVPGIIWALVWFAFFRDRASVRHVPAGAASAAGNPGGRFPALQMTLACFQYFAGNFTFFICLTWMFSYLQTRYSLTAQAAAAYSVIPLLAGASSQWISGRSVDWIYRRVPRWSRRGPAAAGFLLAAAALLALPGAESALAASLWFAVAAFGADSTISPSWTFCQDIGGMHTAALSGLMNMIGNFGAMASAALFPLLRTNSGEPIPYFVAAAALNGASALAWLRMKGREAQ
jgi:ACS family glucarate transporter-like MFS transporter